MSPEERARSDAEILDAYAMVREAMEAVDWTVLPAAAYRLYMAAQKRREAVQGERRSEVRN